MNAQEHSWRRVQFVFGSWIECTCGFAPKSQDEFDNHASQKGGES